MEFHCPLCDKDVPTALIISHIPSCYRDFCLTGKVIPYCTCGGCKGAHTHPGDVPHEQNLLNLPLNAPTNHQENQAPTIAQISETTSSISFEELQGKRCIACKKHKAKSQVPIPYICIGKFRKVINGSSFFFNSISRLCCV